MRCFKIIKDGYVLAIGVGTTGATISEDEYNCILAAIQSCPTPPAGCGCRLKTDLTWELYALPSDAQEDEESTSEDYQAALAELGVSV